MKHPNGETRHIVVDDSDLERFIYTGEWTQDNGPGPDFGTQGRAFNATTHLTNSSTGASLSFTFQGSAVAVYGSIRNDRNATALHNWECYYDGTTLFNTTRYTNVSQSNEALCEWDTVPKNVPHTISLNVTSPGADFFRFDYIQYIPTSSEDFENAAVQILQNDPSVVTEYGFEVTRQRADALKAHVSSAKLVFDFTGTSTSVFGRILKYSPKVRSPLWYILDDDNPTNFTVPIKFGYRFTGIEFFTTPKKPQGPHRLQIFYDGDIQKDPLIIESFTVFNGSKVHSGQSIDPITPNSTNGTNSNTSIPNAVSASQKINLPAIVGGAVGGSVFIAILTIGILWLWRRRASKRDLTAYPASLDASSITSEHQPVTRLMSEAATMRDGTAVRFEGTETSRLSYASTRYSEGEILPSTGYSKVA